MKKLVFIFCLLFSLSFLTLNADIGCSSIQPYHVGKIKEGDTFKMYVAPGSNITFVNITLQYVGTSNNYAEFRLVEGDMLSDTPVPIGEVAIGKTCYTIYGHR
ncbi:MAG: hypothetical protein E6772_01370 [Dysgonomonas sp.]|nr:hypothetical protein [Dysgonomonas sp.]